MRPEIALGLAATVTALADGAQEPGTGTGKRASPLGLQGARLPRGGAVGSPLALRAAASPQREGNRNPWALRIPCDESRGGEQGSSAPEADGRRFLGRPPGFQQAFNRGFPLMRAISTMRKTSKSSVY